MAIATRQQLRALGWPLYLVALLFVASPVMEVVVQVWPVKLGEPAWRFGAAGSLSQALIVPVVGAFLALLAAVLLEHRIAQRVVSLIAGLGALILAAALVAFLLDALQLKRTVRPESVRGFELAVLRSLVVMLYGAGLAGFLCVLGLRSLPKKESTGGVGLVGAARTPVESRT